MLLSRGAQGTKSKLNARRRCETEFFPDPECPLSSTVYRVSKKTSCAESIQCNRGRTSKKVELMGF